MNKMTGKEFVELIKKDPSWCLGIKEETEIITNVNLGNSNIKHLSPLLTFKGKNIDGWVASFYNCKKLKIATGTFHGLVNFADSGIEKIENLNVKGTNQNGTSSTFYACKNLKIATGTFAGAVIFDNSGVETIKDLIVVKRNKKEEGALFFNCNIKYVPKKYRKKGFLFEEGIKRNSILKDEVKKIKSETNNIII